MLLTAAVVCGAAHASAQRADSTAARGDSSSRSLACAAYGTTLRFWAGGPDSATSPVSPASAAERSASRRRAILDTVITLDITDRSWTRDSVTAGVAIGASGTAGARRSSWHACAGASVLLGRVTATLRNVHGLIRFRADPSALQSIGLSSGNTSPAGPPRR